MIYQPTCIAGVLSEEYSVVLLAGNSSSASIAALIVTGSSVSFQERSVSIINNGSYDYGAPVAISGNCSNGEMNLGASGTLYSNGKLLIWRTGLGDVYMGAIKSSVATLSADLQSKRFSKYTQVFAGELSPSNSLGTWLSTAGLIDTDTNATSTYSSFKSSFGAVRFGGSGGTSNATWKVLANTYTTSTAASNRILGNGGFDAPFFGFAVSSVGMSGKGFVAAASRKTRKSKNRKAKALAKQNAEIAEIRLRHYDFRNDYFVNLKFVAEDRALIFKGHNIKWKYGRQNIIPDRYTREESHRIHYWMLTEIAAYRFEFRKTEVLWSDAMEALWNKMLPNKYCLKKNGTEYFVNLERKALEDFESDVPVKSVC